VQRAVADKKEQCADDDACDPVFAAIYLVWGSTYLAIRYAVETIPPLVTAGIRAPA
jgi:hypothetical protein